MRSLLPLAIAAAAALPATPACAGGPLRFDQNGAVVWDTTAPIKYKVDRGPFRTDGAKVVISSDAAVASIRRAFDFWSSVPTASIRFQFAGLLEEDVTTAARFLAIRGDPTQGNVVILDHDGAITDGIFGVGNSSRVLGFANPVREGNRIVRFYSVMNGRLATSVEQFEPTFVHEFGHAVGLDHSQIHLDVANNGIPDDDDLVPIMFPTDTDSEKATPPRARKLHPDDIAWLSTLYKNGHTAAAFGTIRGRVVRSSDPTKAVLGANVVAIHQDNLLIRCSCVSDYLAKGTGEFLIPVPPGKYKLFIEPIAEDFTAGSSVGPHSEDLTGESFRTRVKQVVFPTVQTVQGGNTTAEITLKAELQPDE
jgi:hypothetical protein